MEKTQTTLLKIHKYPTFHSTEFHSRNFDYNQHLELINHLLLIFKFYSYTTRNTKQLNFDNLMITIKKIKEIEKEFTSSNKLKLLKKWHPIYHMTD